MLLLIQFTLMFASVLTLVAFGGMFSERSGVINLGLEGCMVIGALGSALVMNGLPSDTPLIFVLLLTVIVSVICGLVYSMLLAVASIKFKADQTITGIALNILAPAFATVVVKAVTLRKENQAKVSLTFFKFRNAFKFSIGKLEISYLFIVTIILVAVAYIILYKTKFGLRLKACGEFPQSAASAGVNVIKYRYIGVGISGILAGLGGLAYITSGTTQWVADQGVSGFGFLALAVMIFGGWKPISIFLGALLFGFFRAFNQAYTGLNIEFLNNFKALYKMLPYIVCLIVLAFTSKKSRAPKAEGIPYDRGQR